MTGSRSGMGVRGDFRSGIDVASFRKLFGHFIHAALVRVHGAGDVFLLAVDAVADDELVIVNEMAVKVRAVDAGNLRLAADVDAAAAAHARPDDLFHRMCRRLL